MPTIQSLRRSRGMTLVELAVAVGVPARTLGELELGLLSLDAGCAARLAAFFGITPALLGLAPAIPQARTAPLRGAVLTAALVGGLLCQASAPSLAPTLRQWNAPARRIVPSVGQRPARSAQITAPHSRQQTQANRLPTAAPIPTATPISTATPTATATPTPEPPRNTALLPLPPNGPFRKNVLAALEANGAALQHVIVPPGDTWSFNRAVGDPDLLDLVSINGVYGGGWCDLASRYVLALRPFLPREALEFTRHVDTTGYGLTGVADDDAVAIWNSNGGDDEHDLVIHNTGGQMLVVNVMLTNEGVQVSATYR